MVDPPENSEEVRLILAEIMTILVSSTVFDCLRPYVTEVINILRALCMDPSGNVIIEACQAMREFAASGGEMLLHFCQVMGRALFTSFVHKHAKVRIAGLKSLYDVAFTGQWKESHEIFTMMVGFRDPNLVPIKDFYEPSTKFNYFAAFVSDRSTVVRECFYKTIGDLLMRLPDKYDHEGRLFPYLISGLYDPLDSVKLLVFEILEELGEVHEKENEEKFRERKQLDFHEEWTIGGLIEASQVDLPFPISHRPRLGARVQVRSYVRRYIKAIYKEMSDWIEENAERVSHLLLFSIIYCEDFMTQYMDEMLVAMYKNILNKNNKVISGNVSKSFKLLGRYCPTQSYESLLILAIKNDLASYYPYTQTGSLKAFGYLFHGAVELLPESSHLSRVQPLLKNFVETVNDFVIDALDQELGEILVETINEVVESLLVKQRAGIDVKYVLEPHMFDIFKMVLRALSVFQSYKIQSKIEPDSVKVVKKTIDQLFDKMTEISVDSDSLKA